MLWSVLVSLLIRVVLGSWFHRLMRCGFWYSPGPCKEASVKDCLACRNILHMHYSLSFSKTFYCHFGVLKCCAQLRGSEPTRTSRNGPPQAQDSTARPHFRHPKCQVGIKSAFPTYSRLYLWMYSRLYLKTFTVCLFHFTPTNVCKLFLSKLKFTPTKICMKWIVSWQLIISVSSLAPSNLVLVSYIFSGHPVYLPWPLKNISMRFHRIF